MKMHKCCNCTYAGEYEEPKFRPFGVCTKTTNLIEAEKAYNAEVCPFAVQRQNAIELAIKYVSMGEIDFSGIYHKALNEEISETILAALNFMKQAEGGDRK